MTCIHCLLSLQALREMTPVDNCPSGKRALNKEKNRYRNVLPCKFFKTKGMDSFNS